MVHTEEVIILYKERQENCSQRIAKGLEIRKMTQAELRRLTGIPKSSMSLYLSGAYEPKQDRIYLISKALNVSEAWLMGYDVPMSRNTPSKQELTESEEIMLNLFRRLTEENQKVVVEWMRIATLKHE
jgi:transcriptional regulator with XRE-family HTH domain